MLITPRVGRVIDLPLIGDPKPSFREVVQIAKRINRDLGTKMLAQMNLFLAVAAIQEDLERDNHARWKIQERLIATTVSEERLQQLKHHLRAAHLRENVIFHRAQLLAAIKLVALFGDPVAGNKLESREDLNVVTELALAINSLLNFGPIPDGTEAVVRHLAPQLAPARELENVPRIDHAIVRSHLMLGPILDAKRDLPLASELEQLFVFLTRGFAFEPFQNVLFGAFAYFQSLSLTDLPKFQREAFMNPHAPNNIIAGPLLEQFLANLALDAGDIPGLVPAIKDERALFFDQTFFRANPVWRYSPEHYLCVDLCFVVEKLASGFYWAVNKALAVDDSQSSRSRTYSFSRLWGRLFEDYVIQQLSTAYPAASRQLVETPFFEQPYEEAFDAIVLEGANAIVIQIKGTFVRSEAKYSGHFEPFFRGISEKFGNLPGAAIRQLVSSTRNTFCLPRRRRLPTVPVKEIRVVWPVIIALEPIMGFGLSSRLIIERFVHRARKVIPQAYTSIRPPVLLEIEDLEVLIPHLIAGEFTFTDVLREKLGEDQTHIYSFHDFYWGHFVPSRKLPFKKNPLIEGLYHDLGERSLDRFRSGLFKEYQLTPYGAVFPRAQLRQTY